MPVIEMRESLGDQPFLMEDGQDTIKVITKRINLKEGSYQRNMLQMDLFFDDFPYYANGTAPGVPAAFPGWIEFFVTPTPMIETIENIQQLPRRGPNASNTNVLFKATIAGTEVTNAGGKNTVIVPVVSKFPQDFLATNANFPFFHDQLYLTMIFHAYDTGVIFPIDIRFNASVYLSYNEKKVSSIRSAMGVIAERFNMRIAQNAIAGRLLTDSVNLVGQIIPSYAWGGIRPEYMVSGSTLSQFWLTQDGQQPEQMQSTSSLRAFANDARLMVQNPEAFGTEITSQGSVPDWFKQFLPVGVESGPIRPLFPPKVTQDNPALPGLGQTLMV